MERRKSLTALAAARGFASVSFAILVLCFSNVPPASAATPACIAAPSGLVSWWPGDSNENDIVGVNNPSSFTAVSLVPGEVLKGFSFATNGYILIPQSSTLMNQTFTWAAWVRPDGAGPNNDFGGNVIVSQNIDNTHDSVGLSWRATDRRFVFFFGDVSSA